MREPNWLSDLAARNAEDYRSIPERIRAAAELEHRRRTIEATKRNLGPARQAAGLADALEDEPAVDPWAVINRLIGVIERLEERLPPTQTVEFAQADECHVYSYVNASDEEESCS